MSAALEQLIRDSQLDPASCVLRHVTRTSRLAVSAFDAALRPVGLTSHQFTLLMVLARNGAMSVNRLAEAVGMHATTTPRLITPLAKDGLVRVESGLDRRERLISITGKGNQKLLRAYPRWAALQRGILGHLGNDEWRSGMKILKEIRNSIRTSTAT